MGDQSRRQFLCSVAAIVAAPVAAQVAAVLPPVYPITLSGVPIVFDTTTRALIEVTRRAYVPRLVVEIYKSDPMLEALGCLP